MIMLLFVALGSAARRVIEWTERDPLPVTPGADDVTTEQPTGRLACGALLTVGGMRAALVGHSSRAQPKAQLVNRVGMDGPETFRHVGTRGGRNSRNPRGEGEGGEGAAAGGGGGSRDCMLSFFCSFITYMLFIILYVYLQLYVHRICTLLFNFA